MHKISPEKDTKGDNLFIFTENTSIRPMLRFLSLKRLAERWQWILLLVTFPLFLVVACSHKSTDNDPGVVPDPVKPPYAWEKFCMGVDLSYVNEVEDFGGIFRDSGQISDPFRILKKYGANTVRVRLWYDPQWVGPLTGGKLYSDLADVEKTIRRAREAGMAVNLDFHYSDTWADPGHQETPAAWAGLALAPLGDSVYNYTLRVLNYLKEKSLTPQMVQVGNETNGGMLFPAGQVNNGNYASFASLLSRGIKAVRDFSASSDIKPKIILHVAQMQNAQWWIDDLVKKGNVSDFDILGISHYCKWSTMNRFDRITNLISALRSAYGKQVMIVETAYPWTGGNADSYSNIFGPADTVAGYPATTAGQLAYYKALTQAVIAGGGTGIIYWEPAWITSSMKDKWGTGSAWDNCTLFDFTGSALPSAGFMRAAYNF